jgi:hypothetical protein
LAEKTRRPEARFIIAAITETSRLEEGQGDTVATSLPEEDVMVLSLEEEEEQVEEDTESRANGREEDCSPRI